MVSNFLVKFIVFISLVHSLSIFEHIDHKILLTLISDSPMDMFLLSVGFFLFSPSWILVI